MEDAEQESYKLLVKDIQPLSYQDVAEDWEKNSKEWYHALITITDLPIVLAIPDLKIYAWCRCKIFFRNWWEVTLMVGSNLNGGK